MRRLPWVRAELYRFRRPNSPWDSEYGDPFGSFVIPRPEGTLRCIVSNGDYKAAGIDSSYAWEHVSVSLENRCPTWEEMCFVKNMFWTEEECVIQYHPPASLYRNFHPYTLHLWRPLLSDIPLPPPDTVGPK